MTYGYVVGLQSSSACSNPTSGGGSYVAGSFTFDTEIVTLNLSTAGTGTGSVTSNPAGINCGADCTESYARNTTVTLTATPALHSSFTVWKGCTTMSGNTCTVSMTAAKTVTATFVADTKYALKTVKGGTGTGTITSDLAGISCPLDCTESYWKNEVVTLTATPSANSMFSGWSGSCTGTQSTCEVTMTAAKSVTATFIPYPALTVIKSGTGTGAITGNDDGINCGNVEVPDCSEVYTTPDTVVLTATPALHSSFTVWKGCTTMSGNTCTVSMTAAKTVTATFVADTKYALKAVKGGTGTGTITSDLAGISCPLDCTESYWKNEVVTLTATHQPTQCSAGGADHAQGHRAHAK